MNIEKRLRQRIELQQTEQEQLRYKAMRKQAELAEEEEFKKQVRSIYIPPDGA